MPNEENLKGHGFHERTAEEQREIAIAGGKASGEARRRKANFRKTLNLLLTAKIDSPEWTPILESLGLDSTLESALNMAMIKEGLSGNVKAYEAIARYAGQSEMTEADEAEQKIRTDRARRARDQEIGDETGAEENIRAFMKAMRPTQEELDNLFTEEGVEDGEEAEETGKV
ncbi:hypothetical protein [Diplocloster agilis]|uniref:Uncharacterized protein n=1 Tax=Diplocloster agilis TaxID=2850323 RepID=A0A949NI43_9FIRM|nr:hypothetical protein [Diplocloster agilis]MBU9739338.1 hypothetical protein [Diplocloster agilis]